MCVCMIFKSMLILYQSKERRRFLLGEGQDSCPQREPNGLEHMRAYFQDMLS